MSPERFRGRADLTLSAEGKRQVEAAGERLARDFHIGAIFTSPLKRCLETSAIVETATGLAPRSAPELNDIDYGAWTGRVQAEMAAEQPEAWRLWRESPERVRFPNGEGLHDVIQRVAGLLTRLSDPSSGAVTALITHDSVIRAVVIYALGLQPSLYHRLRVSPASLTELSLVEPLATLVRLNDTGHLS
jgi:probable phosphoglycerate mutase